MREATKLLLHRATSAHEPLLRRWLKVLNGEQAEEYGVLVYQTISGETKEHPLLPAHTAKPRSELAWLKNPRGNFYNDNQVLDDVTCFLSLLSDSSLLRPLAQASAATNVADLWMFELQRFLQLDLEDEEARRQLVAREIQSVFRANVEKWENCDVVVFGSSFSRYGLQDSDLDLSLFPAGRDVEDNDSTPRLGVVGTDVVDWEDPATNAERVEQLQELRARVFQQIQNRAERFQEMADSGKYAAPHRVGEWRRMEFLGNELRVLYNGIMTELSALYVQTDPQYSEAEAVVATRELVIDDLDLVGAILQGSSSCDVREVVHGARVPIVRFVHKLNDREYDCDLSINNRLATRSTLLLRAYATFDDSARVLGLVVKHWAKHRSIVGTINGFLSSYSIVLLTIYYLQLVGVLPNLQDPELLEFARVPQITMEGRTLPLHGCRHCAGLLRASFCWVGRVRDAADHAVRWVL